MALFSALATHSCSYRPPPISVYRMLSHTTESDMGLQEAVVQNNTTLQLYLHKLFQSQHFALEISFFLKTLQNFLVLYYQLLKYQFFCFFNKTT